MEDQERHPIRRIFEKLDVTRHPYRIELVSSVFCGLNLGMALIAREMTEGLVCLAGAGAAYIAVRICDNEEERKASREM